MCVLHVNELYMDIIDVHCIVDAHIEFIFCYKIHGMSFDSVDYMKPFKNAKPFLIIFYFFSYSISTIRNNLKSILEIKNGSTYILPLLLRIFLKI